MLKVLRNFKDRLDGQYFVVSTPDTYRSYCHGVEEILEPVYKKIMEIEDTVRKQGTSIYKFYLFLSFLGVLVYELKIAKMFPT